MRLLNKIKNIKFLVLKLKNFIQINFCIYLIAGFMCLILYSICRKRIWSHVWLIILISIHLFNRLFYYFIIFKLYFFDFLRYILIFLEHLIKQVLKVVKLLCLTNLFFRIFVALSIGFI